MASEGVVEAQGDDSVEVTGEAGVVVEPVPVVVMTQVPVRGVAGPAGPVKPPVIEE